MGQEQTHSKHMAEVANRPTEKPTPTGFKSRQVDSVHLSTLDGMERLQKRRGPVAILTGHFYIRSYMQKPQLSNVTIILPKDTKDAIKVAQDMIAAERQRYEKEKALYEAYKQGYEAGNRGGLIKSIFPFPF